jgi:phosphoglycolate phosphatase-like HAD superfamily hydrolase
MKLAIFDIDGTLTDTCAVDDRCYAIAAAELFGVPVEEMRWDGTPHHTDSGILGWLCERSRGSAPTAAETDAVRSRFVAELGSVCAREPAHFAPIPGACEVFAALGAAGWNVALATGGWGASARFKLTTAGIDHAGVPLGCADDGLSRAEIVRTALLRSIERYGGPFERVVVLGDRPWDVTTAVEVGLPFVGLGIDDKAEALRAFGARTVLRDYCDVPAVIAALDSAVIPVASGPPESPG